VRYGLLRKLVAISALIVGVSSVSTRATATEYSNEHTLLKQGRIGSAYKWQVFIRQWTSGEAAKLPCLESQIGPTPSSNVIPAALSLCGNPNPFPLTLWVKSHESDEAHKGSGTGTILAIVLDPIVSVVEMQIAGRLPLRIHTQLIDKVRAREAHIRRFPFVVRAFSGPFCLRRIRTYDAEGDALRSFKYGC